MPERTVVKTATFTLAAVLAVQASAAHCESTRDAAAGRVEIVRPVGTGIAFDILHDAISAVFLTGPSDHAVTLLSSRLTRAGMTQIPPGTVVSTIMFGLVPRHGRLGPGVFHASAVAEGNAGNPVQPLLFLAQYN